MLVLWNRSGFDELSSRVKHLEDVVLSTNSFPPHPENPDPSVEKEGQNRFSNNLATDSIASTSGAPPTISSYSGSLSPWNILITTLEPQSNDQPVATLYESAKHIAKEDRSSPLDPQVKSYNFKRKFPHLSQNDCVLLARTYAKEAPYPILHFDSLMEVTTRITHSGNLTRWGQIVCVLVVRASFHDSDRSKSCP